MSAGSALGSLFALALVLALIFALAALARRLRDRHGAAASALSLKAGLSVGVREKVLWLRAGEVDLLVGVAPGQIRTLHVFAPGSAPATPAAETMPPFAQRLADLLKTPERGS